MIKLLLLCLLSFTPAIASANTRARVKELKDTCILENVKKYSRKFVHAGQLSTQCACFANNYVQGLDVEPCKGPNWIDPEQLDKAGFYWD